MPPRSAAERRRLVSAFRHRFPGRELPVEVRAPGLAVLSRTPARASLNLVRSLIEQHQAELARLTRDEIVALAPVFAQIERELGQKLREWSETTLDGDLRWTAQAYREAKLQARYIGKQLQRALEGRLIAGGEAAQRLALSHLAREVATFAGVFGGAPLALNLDAVRLIATGKSYLLPRYRTSAARYGADREPVGVAHDIRQRLAVDIGKGLSVFETVTRLQEEGGLRGLVALRGVIGEAGTMVQSIPEGLFRRYRYWAERVVRTELISTYNAQLNAALEETAEIVPSIKRRWFAAAGACQKICSPMDGVTVNIGEQFTLPTGEQRPGPPGHPNCKSCRVGPWRDDWNDILKQAGVKPFSGASGSPATTPVQQIERGAKEKDGPTTVKPARIVPIGVGASDIDMEEARKAASHILGSDKAVAELGEVMAVPSALPALPDRHLAEAKLSASGAYVVTKLKGHATVLLQGEILDGENPTGEGWGRTFHRDGHDLVVGHGTFFLDDNYQGRGVGEAVLRNAFRWYERSGVKRVELFATEIGRYTWARFGFNWTTTEATRRLPELATFLADNGVERGAAERIAQETVEQAWKVAAIEVDGRKLGKEYLLQGWSWEGSVPVDKSDPGYQQTRARLKLDTK